MLTPNDHGQGTRLCKHEHVSILEAYRCAQERTKTPNGLHQSKTYAIHNTDSGEVLTLYQLQEALRQEQLLWDTSRRRHNPQNTPYISFQQVPRLMEGSYNATIPLNEVKNTLNFYDRSYGLDIDPDFQRVHVWTQDQKSAFVEHVLREGRNTTIRWNCPGWNKTEPNTKQGPVTLVDGKQRLYAILDFMDDHLPAFGRFISEWKGILSITCNLNFIMNDLETKAEVLKWYLELNRGNVAHTPDELDRVEELLRNETYSNPT